MIAKMKDEKSYYYTWFYDNVIELSNEESIDMAKTPFSIDKYKMP